MNVYAGLTIIAVANGYEVKAEMPEGLYCSPGDRHVAGNLAELSELIKRLMVDVHEKKTQP